MSNLTPTPEALRSLQAQLRNERARANNLHLALLEARDYLQLALDDYESQAKVVDLENGQGDQARYWASRATSTRKAIERTYSVTGGDA